MRKELLLLFVALIGVGASYAQTATVGTPFTYQLAPASTAGYGFSVNGVQNTTIPGLNYKNTTGILSGTPTTAGTYAISVQQATATAGVYTTTELTLTVNAAGTTPPVTPPVTPPSTLFCATDTNPACGVVLTWKAPAPSTTAALAVTGYLVFRSTGSTTAVEITAAPITAVTYTDKTIAPSTTYDYYVVSVDAAGTQSAPSNILSVVVAAAPSVPTPATPTGLTGSVVN